MVTMHVRLEGIPQSKEMIELVRQAASDMRSGFRSVGEYLLHVYSVEVFESEGAIYGKRWAPLNPKYSLWKSTRYPGRGILERTGRMRRSFRAVSTRDYLTINNSVEYLRKHQNGDGVPKRVIVDLQKRQRDRVEELLSDDLMRRLRFALK